MTAKNIISWAAVFWMLKYWNVAYMLSMEWQSNHTSGQASPISPASPAAYQLSLYPRPVHVSHSHLVFLPLLALFHLYNFLSREFGDLDLPGYASADSSSTHSVSLVSALCGCNVLFNKILGLAHAGLYLPFQRILVTLLTRYCALFLCCN